MIRVLLNNCRYKYITYSYVLSKKVKSFFLLVYDVVRLMIIYIYIDDSPLVPYEALQCTDGSGDVYRWYFCDGYNDCTDGEDEDEDICRGIACTIHCLSLGL